MPILGLGAFPNLEPPQRGAKERLVKTIISVLDQRHRLLRHASKTSS
jgi:hypothetical protein